MEKEPRIMAESHPVLEEPDVKNFVERRGIRPEDLVIIEELARYPSELSIELVHNLFNMNHERSGGDLARSIEAAEDEDRRRFYELFQKLFAAYDWATCYNLVRILEERKGTPSLLQWEIERNKSIQ